MGSTRLPGKALLPMANMSMTFRLLERVKRSKLVDEVCLSVPETCGIGEDDPFCQIAHYAGVKFDNPRVEENDLVARYLQSAKLCDADIIVRIPGDNPCVDPWAIDVAVQCYLDHPAIFVSNAGDGEETSWPNGIGCEVFSVSRLKWLDKITGGYDDQREHLHQFFHRMDLVREPDYHGSSFPMGLKLDVNTRADYEYVKDIFEACYMANPHFGIGDIVQYLTHKEVNHGQLPRAT